MSPTRAADPDLDAAKREWEEKVPGWWYVTGWEDDGARWFAAAPVDMAEPKVSLRLAAPATQADVVRAAIVEALKFQSR